MRYARARQTGTQDFSTFIDPGREVKVFTFALVTPCLHVLATVGHKASNCWKYGILRAAEDVVRAGVFELCTR